MFAAATCVSRKRQIVYESFTDLAGFRANVLQNCLVDLQVSICDGNVLTRRSSPL